LKIKMFVVCLICAMLFGCLAIAQTQDEALALARSHVPDSASIVLKDTDNIRYSFSFIDQVSGTRYEVKIYRGMVSLVILEIFAVETHGATDVALSAVQVWSAALSLYPGAEVNDVILLKEKEFYSYEVFLTSDGAFFKVRLNAETGALLTSVMTADAAGLDTDGQGEYLSVRQARDKAVWLLGGGIITDLSFETVNGVPIYVIKVCLNGAEYRVSLNAQTGLELRRNSDRVSSMAVFDGVLLIDADGYDNANEDLEDIAGHLREEMAEREAEREAERLDSAEGEDSADDAGDDAENEPPEDPAIDVDVTENAVDDSVEDNVNNSEGEPSGNSGTSSDDTGADNSNTSDDSENDKETGD
jgi:uncharacterized membrane protein YkoI